VPIEFQCSNCGKLLRTGDDTAGKRAKCPKCGAVMTIPTPGTLVAPPQPPAPAEPPGGGKSQPDYAAFPPTSSHTEHEGAAADGFSHGAAAGPSGAHSGGPGSNPDFATAGSGGIPGSVPGQQSGSHATGAGAPAVIDLGDILSTALNIYKSQLGLCVAATAIVMLVIIVAWFAIAFFLSMLPRFLPAWMLYGMLQGPAIVVVIAAAMAQCMRMFWKIARGEPATINDLFQIEADAGRVILTYFAYMLMVYVGSFFCVVPGWILMTLFFPALFLAFERDASVADIFTEALAITEGNRLMIFVVLLVAGLLGWAGSLACGIGVLLTMPFALMCQAVLYLRLTGGPVAAVA
jgi:uncharacterized membrane protein